MPFEAGKSGNPSGRKPDSHQVRAAKELARSKSWDAIKFLVRILEDEKEEIKWRMQAAHTILDRGIGKPAQEQPDFDDSNRPATVADIERALEQLKNGSE